MSISREYFYMISRIKNKCICVNFLPNTKSFTYYGNQIIINPVYNEEEEIEMLQNYCSEPALNTEGIVRATMAGLNKLNHEATIQLKTKGFHTTEIFEVSHT